MQDDLEKLTNALKKNPKTAKSFENMDELKAIADTDEGKKLLKNLKDNGGDIFKKAAGDAANGDKNAAQSLLSSLTQTAEGKAVVQKMMGIIKKQKSEE